MGGVEGSVLDTAEVRVILVSVFVSSNQALFDQLEFSFGLRHPGSS